MSEGIEDLFSDSNCLDSSSFKNGSGDLFHVFGALYDNMKLKVAFIIFISFILLNTDTFADNCLRKISSNTYDLSQDRITGKGVMVSAMLLSVFYIIIDLLATKKII
jgi:hypothetical protein